MLYLLISCVSLILVSKSFTNKQSWDWKFLAIGFWWFHKSRQLDTASLFQLKNTMTSFLSSRVIENVAEEEEEEEEQGVSLLDLPDLTLECILERLSPSGLYNMAGVSTFMRDRCTSDHFWEKHMKQKWGKLIGPAAYREWELYVATESTRRSKLLLSDQRTRKGLFASLSGVFPFSLVMREKLQSSSRVLVHDSVMSLYLSLQSGNFSFPAQVYNRENGNVGFILSCYDAKLCYDSGTDTFQASYSPYGRTTTREENIPWDRLRAAPVDTPPRVLHVSDCLQDLKPGDHIEIQWRRSREFLYGWWYGVIGHLEFCNGNENHCRCHHSDTIVLEFSQYTPGSRWRQMMINRECHREEGNEADGFYGGIRKLYNVEEITKWKRLWPNQVLE